MFVNKKLKRNFIFVLKIIKWFVLFLTLAVLFLSYYFESDKFFEKITLKNYYECNQKNLIKTYLEDEKNQDEISKIVKSEAFSYFSNGLNLLNFDKFYTTERCLNTKEYGYFKYSEGRFDENQDESL